MPDDDAHAIVSGTRSYLQDFLDEVPQAADARDLVARIKRRYPDHANETALILSATTAIQRREADRLEPTVA